MNDSPSPVRFSPLPPLPEGDGKSRKRAHLCIASVMAKTFEVGDHVSWNSEAGQVRGRIVRVHMSDVNYRGYVHHASGNDP